MKTLCFDFGNTRLKFAVFYDDVFTEEITLPNEELFTIERVLYVHQPQRTILSSVINHNPAIETLLAAQTQFHKLSHLTKANFTAAVGKPETMGSCITYNFINQYHQFMGGSISPGMEMRFKAMQVFTDKLPAVQAEWNFPVIGYDTKTNMQSGVIAGIAYEMDGFIDAYAAKYGNFNVVLTGGDSAYFARRLKNRIFADSNFLFKGLYALSETNNG
jgi:type III pantothenate kinase